MTRRRCCCGWAGRREGDGGTSVESKDISNGTRARSRRGCPRRPEPFTLGESNTEVRLAAGRDETIGEDGEEVSLGLSLGVRSGVLTGVCIFAGCEEYGVFDAAETVAFAMADFGRSPRSAPSMSPVKTADAFPSSPVDTALDCGTGG